MSNSSGTNLESNVAGALSYLLGWITGLIFLLLEKDDGFVRFHAIQSIIVFGAWTVVMILFYILWLVPYLGAILSGLWWIVAAVLVIILIIKAYQGERFKLPVAGDLAEKWSQ